MINVEDMATLMVEASWRGGCDKRHVVDVLRAYKNGDADSLRRVAEELMAQKMIEVGGVRRMRRGETL